ncbi:Serine/threonine-protein phosphatase 6 regulatory subunit 1 [Hondaea fermentalgiana]|uniref:Serine/threonine-protein phosphatase 6 regulatory subunit 1 n=1 Tax=Hondaea fermentalgiana TaxID=2315210 RepID=A0A2R5GF72_9STRA|nr:Serine/threonine-protein phosphatase 6 regulatory subunit 1 [Hondaea fermentalgiana]|eukprot:GBG29547.1 Serine/threonine-protein phosphatase 6 regulatory subunit 1 [Hondaea fermentalgiana]
MEEPPTPPGAGAEEAAGAASPATTSPSSPASAASTSSSTSTSSLASTATTPTTSPSTAEGGAGASGAKSGASAAGDTPRQELIFSRLGEIDNESEWTQQKQELLNSMLDLQHVYLSKEMLAFLGHTSSIQALSQIVSQRTESQSVMAQDFEVDSDGVFRWKWCPLESDKTMSTERKLVHGSDALEPSALESDDVPPAIRRSYQLMALLCGFVDPSTRMGGMMQQESFHASQRVLESPSPAAVEFIQSHGPTFFAHLFQAFHPEAKGSLYHVCKLMDVMLRYNAENLVESFVVNKRAFKPALEAALNYIDRPCVADIILSILCPLSGSQEDHRCGFYRVLPKTRIKYFRMLANANILPAIAQHVWLPTESETDLQRHKSAAAELLKNLVQRLSGVEHGAEILESLVRGSEVIYGLITVACGDERLLSHPQERAAREAALNRQRKEEKARARAHKQTKKKGKKGGGKKGKKGGGKAKKKQRTSAETGADGAGDGNGAEDDDEDEDDEPHAGNTADDESHGDASSSSKHTAQRDAALEALHCIVELSTKDKVPSSEVKEYKSFAETQNNVVDCQLATISDKIHNLLDTNFDELCRAFTDPTSFRSSDLGVNVRHTSYTVKHPFSSYRLELIKLIVACIVHKPKVLLKKVAPGHWHSLCDWFFEYEHCNLYHAEFKQLFLTLIRSEESEETLLFVLKDCNFLQRMIDAFSDAERRCRASTSGHILMMCNALRLQVDAPAPSKELEAFLESNEAWAAFLPNLVAETLKLVQSWEPSDPALFISGNPMMQAGRRQVDFQRLTSPGPAPDQSLIDIGSEFAKSLGFSDAEVA